jgi:hypothetical protein
MGVRKYRNIEEMGRDQRRLRAGDASMARKIRHLWRLSKLLLHPVGTCIPRGVRKYRSIEEAQADRTRCELERARRLLVERNRGRN